MHPPAGCLAPRPRIPSSSPRCWPYEGSRADRKARRRPWCHRGQGCQRHRHPRPTRRRRHPRSRRHPRNQQSQNRRHHAPAARRSSCRRARTEPGDCQCRARTRRAPTWRRPDGSRPGGPQVPPAKGRAYGAGRRDDGLCLRSCAAPHLLSRQRRAPGASMPSGRISWHAGALACHHVRGCAGHAPPSLVCILHGRAPRRQADARNPKLRQMAQASNGTRSGPA